eukprot:TRINITY_DN3391_c0_g1_i24.p2 TRINITY_DN3391_c0_g1~~TRINITY_DN3391_c0_g1_i24.p2  ORF type:complete len:201 (+),score=69.58 TRINITY_DN3391_c0_g1_i24:634-1236(+)
MLFDQIVNPCVRMYDAVESCQFGSFLFDNEAEAAELGAGTTQAWDWLLAPCNQQCDHNTLGGVIGVEPGQLRVWARMHLQRWGNSSVLAPCVLPPSSVLATLACNSSAMLGAVFGGQAQEPEGLEGLEEVKEQPEPGAEGEEANSMDIFALVGDGLTITKDLMSRVMSSDQDTDGALHLPYDSTVDTAPTAPCNDVHCVD